MTLLYRDPDPAAALAQTPIQNIHSCYQAKTVVSGAGSRHIASITPREEYQP